MSTTFVSPIGISTSPTVGGCSWNAGGHGRAPLIVNALSVKGVTVDFAVSVIVSVPVTLLAPMFLQTARMSSGPAWYASSNAGDISGLPAASFNMKLMWSPTLGTCDGGPGGCSVGSRLRGQYQ